jgi:outer membrane protein assembly factor BamB
MRQISAALLIPIGCAALSTVAHAQFGRGGNDWNTAGFDAQRSSWLRSDAKISKESLSKPGFALTWKIGLAKDSKMAGALAPPILLNSYIGYRGFRSFAFVGGTGDNIYTVDTDLSRLEWHNHFPPASALPPGCAASTVPAVARPSGAAFPAAPLAGRGGGRGGARSTVGEPGEGAASLALNAARAGGLTPAPPVPAGRGAAAARGAVPGAFGNANRRAANSVYVLTSDGMLHAVFLASGEVAEDAIKFLPPGAGARGLIVLDNVAYAATMAGCGGAGGVSALDLATKQVTSWNPAGVTVVGAEGPAVGPDDTLYVASAGTSPAVTALEAKTLQQKDWYTSSGDDLASSPVLFQYKDGTLLAVASKNRKIILLDTKSLGGADHRTPLFTAPVETAVEALSSWQDASGTRWLLGATAGGVRAWKLVDRNGAPALEAAWVSGNIASPVAPIIVNGVVFSASKGSPSSAAVLYALDPATGKELWNSGKIMSSFIADGGLSAGGTQVFAGTADGTLYAFGFPIEH